MKQGIGVCETSVKELKKKLQNLQKRNHSI
jgi:hypothetical protein